jgi:hypothetical protein
MAQTEGQHQRPIAEIARRDNKMTYAVKDAVFNLHCEIDSGRMSARLACRLLKITVDDLNDLFKMFGWKELGL